MKRGLDSAIIILKCYFKMQGKNYKWIQKRIFFKLPNLVRSRIHVKEEIFDSLNPQANLQFNCEDKNSNVEK